MYSQKLSFRDQLAKNYINALGWRTKRKLVLIESDDWGAVRMASLDAYNKHLAAGAGEGSYFDQFDSVETSDDVALLLDVLSSFKDHLGHNPVFEPFAVVANPNYEAIKDNNASKYIYESFIETYKRSPLTENTFEVIKEGIRSGLWSPQFHGREHIQVNRWMKALQSDYPLAKLDFDLHSFHSGCTPPGVLYYNAFDYESDDELSQIKDIVSEGVDLFKKIYQFAPVSVCPPCGYSNDNLISFMESKGLMLQTGQFFYPVDNGKHKTANNFWGKKGNLKLRFYRRNCKFEPSRNHSIDWVDRCMTEMEIAFRWGKPAVIDSHRVNYIGSIHVENRDYTLKEMTRLFHEIVKRWPDVEFVNSQMLYDEIIK